jgi:hypothetical protein
MKFILVLITFVCTFFYSKNGVAQEKDNNSFKVSIAEHGLHCPNLGPKLKVNIKQIGGEVLYFNSETSIMLVSIPSQDTEKSNSSYLEKIIQLTGYPDDLIKVDEISSAQVIEFLEKNTKDEK